jgi:ribonucleoside-diphosphate reductase alpha chain
MSEEKQARLDECLDEMKQARKSYTCYWSEVVSVEPTEVRDVYNLTTDVSHSLIANGMVVANCGEQPLSAYSVCNLGAINLARFYDAGKHDVAWDALGQTVHYSVRFLDNDRHDALLLRGECAGAGAERRIGLGTMGIAELMIRLGIRYGSDEAVEFIDRLYEFITVNAYQTSIELAAEKGSFSRFDAEKFLESGFMQTMPDEVREGVRTRGIRNVTLLTQAPTALTGSMVNTSTHRAVLLVEVLPQEPGRDCMKRMRP